MSKRDQVLIIEPPNELTFTGMLLIKLGEFYFVNNLKFQVPSPLLSPAT